MVNGLSVSPVCSGIITPLSYEPEEEKNRGYFQVFQIGGSRLQQILIMMFVIMLPTVSASILAIISMSASVTSRSSAERIGDALRCYNYLEPVVAQYLNSSFDDLKKKYTLQINNTYTEGSHDSDGGLWNRTVLEYNLQYQQQCLSTYKEEKLFRAEDEPMSDLTFLYVWTSIIPVEYINMRWSHYVSLLHVNKARINVYKFTEQIFELNTLYCNEDNSTLESDILTQHGVISQSIFSSSCYLKHQPTIKAQLHDLYEQSEETFRTICSFLEAKKHKNCSSILNPFDTSILSDVGDLLFETSSVHNHIIDFIDSDYNDYLKKVTTTLILMSTALIIIMSISVITGTWYVRSLFAMLTKTSDMAEWIGDRSTQIISEKKRSEAVLKEMLPLSTVHQLLTGQDVTPQFYGSATIHFSQVVGFEDMTSSYSALIVVEFLNGLYRSV